MLKNGHYFLCYSGSYLGRFCQRGPLFCRDKRFVNIQEAEAPVVINHHMRYIAFNGDKDLLLFVEAAVPGRLSHWRGRPRFKAAERAKPPWNKIK